MCLLTHGLDLDSHCAPACLRCPQVANGALANLTIGHNQGLDKIANLEREKKVQRRLATCTS